MNAAQRSLLAKSLLAVSGACGAWLIYLLYALRYSNLLGVVSSPLFYAPLLLGVAVLIGGLFVRAGK
jgi:hypothetical protein